MTHDQRLNHSRPSRRHVRQSIDTRTKVRVALICLPSDFNNTVRHPPLARHIHRRCCRRHDAYVRGRQLLPNPRCCDRPLFRSPCNVAVRWTAQWLHKVSTRSVIIVGA
jgi:hypothetical protein